MKMTDAASQPPPPKRSMRPPISSMPPDKNMVKRETHCSRIIQQRCQREVRFRPQMTFLRILEHAFAGAVPPPAEDGAYPRPLSSPFPCFNCHQRFETAPVFIPMTSLDGAQTEWGNFCSGPCANAYLHTNMNDSNLPGRAADLFEYMQEVHGFDGEQLGLAPHFSQLQAYGGDLTPEQFAFIVGNARLTTHIRMKPFIPTEVVIEWQLTGTAEGARAAVANTTALATAMGDASAAPQRITHHKTWTVRDKVQPTLDKIEERLASLPPTEKCTGLYELFLQRMGGFPSEGQDAGPAPAAASVNTRAPSRSKSGKKPPAAPKAPPKTSLMKLLKTHKKRPAGAGAPGPAAPPAAGPAV